MPHCARPTPASPSTHHTCNIQVLLLNREHLLLTVDSRSKLQEVFNQVCTHLGLRESEYFGLAWLTDGEYRFLDLNTKIQKCIPRSLKSQGSKGILELYFRVQFYVDNVLVLRERTTRHLYYLQLRENLMSYSQHVNEEQSFLVAALALQADNGNYQHEKHHGTTYFDAREYFPAWVVDKWGGEYISNNLPFFHRDLIGMSRTEAETRVIRDVSCSPAAHNLHFYQLKKRKTDRIPTAWLAICTSGLQIYEDSSFRWKDLLSTFLWGSIEKLYFQRKKFSIRVEGSPEGRKFTYFTSSEDQAKYLLNQCQLTHKFQLTMTPKMAELQRFSREGSVHYREAVVSSTRLRSGYRRQQNHSSNKAATMAQRISVVSSASSNTTSGIVSDRLHISFDDSEVADGRDDSGIRYDAVPMNSFSKKKSKAAASASTKVSPHDWSETQPFSTVQQVAQTQPCTNYCPPNVQSVPQGSSPGHSGLPARPVMGVGTLLSLQSGSPSSPPKTLVSQQASGTSKSIVTTKTDIPVTMHSIVTESPSKQVAEQLLANQQAVNSLQHPVTSQQPSFVSLQQPISSLQQPINSLQQQQQTISCLQQPISSLQQQQTISCLQQPISSLQQQQTISCLQQPISSLQQQQTISCLQQPISSLQQQQTISSLQPINSLQQPINSLQQQQTISSLQQPINSLQQPINSLQQQQMINSLQQPINSLQHPATPLQQQVSSLHQPVISQQQVTALHQPVISQQQASSLHQPVISQQQASSLHQPVISQQQASSLHQPVISQQVSALHQPVISQQQASSLHQSVISQQQAGSLHQPVISQQQALSSFKPPDSFFQNQQQVISRQEQLISYPPISSQIAFPVNTSILPDQDALQAHSNVLPPSAVGQYDGMLLHPSQVGLTQDEMLLLQNQMGILSDQGLLHQNQAGISPDLPLYHQNQVGVSPDQILLQPQNHVAMSADYSALFHQNQAAVLPDQNFLHQTVLGIPSSFSQAEHQQVMNRDISPYVRGPAFIPEPQSQYAGLSNSNSTATVHELSSAEVIENRSFFSPTKTGNLVSMPNHHFGKGDVNAAKTSYGAYMSTSDSVTVQQFKPSAEGAESSSRYGVVESSPPASLSSAVGGPAKAWSAETDVATSQVLPAISGHEEVNQEYASVSGVPISMNDRIKTTPPSTMEIPAVVIQKESSEEAVIPCHSEQQTNKVIEESSDHARSPPQQPAKMSPDGSTEAKPKDAKSDSKENKPSLRASSTTLDSAYQSQSQLSGNDPQAVVVNGSPSKENGNKPSLGLHTCSSPGLKSSRLQEQEKVKKEIDEIRGMTKNMSLPLIQALCNDVSLLQVHNNTSFSSPGTSAESDSKLYSESGHLAKTAGSDLCESDKLYSISCPSYDTFRFADTATPRFSLHSNA